MKILRWLASLLVIGPLVGVIGTVYVMHAASTAVSSGAQPNAETIVHFLRIALFATFLGILAFLFGVVLHALVARKTGTYSRDVWILILAVSILLCVAAFPGGTVLGGATIILLFTLKTFRRMLRNERPGLEQAGDRPAL